MLVAIKERRTGLKYLAHAQHKRGPKATAQPIAVAPGVTVTTSNPATYQRLTGAKVKDFQPRRRAA